MMGHPPTPERFPTQPPRARNRAGRYALALLTVLASAASIFLLVSLNKPAASDIDRRGGTRVTLTPRSPDGSAPSAEDLSQAEHVIGKRVGDARISISGEALTVTVPGQHQSYAENLGQVGRLSIRPVVHSIPAHPVPMAGRRPVGAALGGLNTSDPAERLANEKNMRQSKSQMIQLLALQFEATRCEGPDALADNDDPDLPLVTCSADHKFVYLLGPSIINGNHVREARSQYDEHSGHYVVDLQFDNTAASAWSNFIATHRGTPVAYTVDTRVISAPPAAGEAKITSDLTAFTSDSARQLARTLNSGPLPLPFDTSKPAAVAPNPDSAGLWQSRPPVGLVVTAIGVVAILLCWQAYLYRPDRRRDSGKPFSTIQ